MSHFYDAAALVADDDDQVAQIVAHDAAAGLPGWKRVCLPNWGEDLDEWVDRMLTGEMPQDTRKAVDQSLRLVRLAVAGVIYHLGPNITRDEILSAVADDLIDARHGAGRAELIQVLTSWWQQLTDDERALTGVQVTA